MTRGPRPTRDLVSLALSVLRRGRAVERRWRRRLAAVEATPSQAVQS